MQLQQKIWPQIVDDGSTSVSMQMGQMKAGSFGGSGLASMTFLPCI